MEFNGKEILANVKNVVNDTAQTVAKKSGEIWDASKTKYAIFDLNNDIKKLYFEIGKLTYLSVEKEEDHTDSIRMKCEIVSAKLARIEALKNNGGKGDFKCPVCGKPSDSTMSFCPSCGADMTVDVEGEVEEV